MRRNSRSWSLSIAGLALGCNAVLGNDVGHLKAAAQSCTLNSDCKTGDLCIFATCSVPCRTDVDCDTGSRCLETAKGAACVASSAAACANDEGCPGGAVCSDQVCRAPCQTVGGTVCHGDQTCTANVCLGADQAHDPAAVEKTDGSAGGGGASSGGARASGGALGGGGIRSSGGASGAGGTSGSGGSTLDAGSATGGTTTTTTGGTTGAGGVTGSGGSTGLTGAPVATLKTMPIDILGGTEAFKCQDFANPFGTDAAIVETNSTMPGIAEQTLVFFGPAFNTTTGSPVDCSGLLFSDFIHDAQTPDDTMKYPADVGRLLKGTDGLRIWTHYLNTTTVTVSAQVSVSLHAVPPTTVHNYAAAMMLNDISLGVPVTNNYTATKVYPAPYDIKMLRAVGLMFSHGNHYKANVGAQVLYEGTNWSAPTPALFSTPLAIASTSAITWACTYQNNTGNTVSFGQSATKNEQCAFYGVFYATLPANQGKLITSTQ